MYISGLRFNKRMKGFREELNSYKEGKNLSELYRLKADVEKFRNDNQLTSGFTQQMHDFLKILDETTSRVSTDCHEEFLGHMQSMKALLEKMPERLPASLHRQGAWVRKVYHYLFFKANCRELEDIYSEVNVEQFRDEVEGYASVRELLLSVANGVFQLNSITNTVFKSLCNDEPISCFVVPECRGILHRSGGNSHPVVLLSSEGTLTYQPRDYGNGLVVFSLDGTMFCSLPTCYNKISGPKSKHRCMRCGLMQYCSQECNKEHWKMNHKRFCHEGCTNVACMSPHRTICANFRRETKLCDVCFSPITEQLHKCNGCKTYRYCSQECQETHWRSSHRIFCELMAQPPA